MLTSVAKAHCGRAYERIAVDNMQIHGGVGYTWEYDAHLYYRRAKSCDVLLGDASVHFERLAHALAEADT
jgi:alkylation response protein AidB-like acyl-CoA dehydrogenase